MGPPVPPPIPGGLVVPPPPPGGLVVPPPPPPPGTNPTQGFKVVPGLGDALHQAIKKISGVEEIAPAAEGVASDATRYTSTPTGSGRPKSWHGAQVPGKPKPHRPLMSEMENRLARRRDKVDAEAYTAEGPDPVPEPPPVRVLPPSGSGSDKTRKPSTASLDSGLGSPGTSTRGSTLEPGGYTRVSVDRDRKEELVMAKAVRRSSAKMLGRDRSPNYFAGSSGEESPVTVCSGRGSLTPPPQQPLPPPSPVVMRYWKQCSANTIDSGYFGEEGIDVEELPRDENGEVIPPWKLEAIEGEEKDFPSISAKIKAMEEEAKKPLAMYQVPDVKNRIKPAAATSKSWMEARGKLQNQLDTLICKTSEKMAKYGSVHAKEKVDFVKDPSCESDQPERSPSPKEIVDKKVKTLIKTVANEIQKSFSAKNVHTLEDKDDVEDDDEEEEESEEERKVREERERQIREEREKKLRERDKRRTIKEVKRRQKHIDVEAPILDFELKEPTPEPESEEEEEVDEVTENIDSASGTINHSVAKDKASIMKKTNSGRRLPAGILAKKKAADKAKEAANVSMKDACTATEAAFTDIELAVAEKLARKEKFSDKVIQTQWEISNAEYELSKMTDNQKATMLSKQISKMKSSHVNKLLRSIDSGVLDISVPLLIPYLSLQARMSLRVDLFKNRFKGADQEDKNKMAKETFVDMMIKDITDIALLQEVIARSQEKVLILSAEDERRFAEKMRQSKIVTVEEDSWELGSANSIRNRSETPAVTEKRETPPRAATPKVSRETTPEINMKEATPEIKEVRAQSPIAKEESPPKTTSKEQDEVIPYGVSDIPDEQNKAEGDKEESGKLKPKEALDEGCPISESDEEKEELKSKSTKDEESDEGLGKSEDDNTSKAEDELPKEKIIKQKILNILQDAKAMDQKRSIRNFGRTFEFQGVKEQLRPVVPNDRRPAKAKRLDTMWSEVTAKKQGYVQPAAPTLEELKARKNNKTNSVPTLEELKARKNAKTDSVPTLDELKNKPKSSVPWTRRGNAQPETKEVLAAQKEVEEFESCRRTLQQNVKNEEVKGSTRKIQTVKKDEIIAICDTAIDEVEAEKVSIESAKDSPKDVESAELKKTKAQVKDKSINLKEESLSKESASKSVESISIAETEDAITEAEGSTKDTENDKQRAKLSDYKETWKKISVSRESTPVTKEATPEIETSKRETTPAKREATPVKKEATPVKREATPIKRETTPIKREATPVKREATPVKRETTPIKREVTPSKKERSPEKPPIAPKPAIAIKEIPSLLLMSPVLRRRAPEVSPSPSPTPTSDTTRNSTTVTVSAMIRLPPPPSFRPPPPPLSPPVPEERVKDLKFGQDTSEEEEESEWEYESEEED